MRRTAVLSIVAILLLPGCGSSVSTGGIMPKDVEMAKAPVSSLSEAGTMLGCRDVESLAAVIEDVAFSYSESFSKDMLSVTVGGEDFDFRLAGTYGDYISKGSSALNSYRQDTDDFSATDSGNSVVLRCIRSGGYSSEYSLRFYAFDDKSFSTRSFEFDRNNYSTEFLDFEVSDVEIGGLSPRGAESDLDSLFKAFGAPKSVRIGSNIYEGLDAIVLEWRCDGGQLDVELCVSDDAASGEKVIRCVNNMQATLQGRL